MSLRATALARAPPGACPLGHVEPIPGCEGLELDLDVAWAGGDIRRRTSGTDAVVHHRRTDTAIGGTVKA